MSTRKIEFFEGFKSEVTPSSIVASGPRGVSFLVGTGVPSSGLGFDGDEYLDSDTGDLYSKSSGSWSLTGNLTIPASGVVTTPTGTIAATDVQGAIAELAAEKIDGPTSATNNALARYDGTSGKLTKDSGVTVDNSGNMEIPGDTVIQGVSFSVDQLSLTAGTTGEVFVLPASEIANTAVNYSIKRGSLKEFGTILMVNDGNNIEYSRTSSNIGGDIGVDFDAILSGTDAKLTFEIDSGVNANMKYTIESWED